MVKGVDGKELNLHLIKKDEENVPAKQQNYCFECFTCCWKEVEKWGNSDVNRNKVSIYIKTWKSNSFIDSNGWKWIALCCSY